ncbi:hypothetical protein GCM10007285_10440 [Stappia taiwanensis]|nr:hypothetical protein GCM10007285_10440 [Stappia taiwanensis]
MLPALIVLAGGLAGAAPAHAEPLRADVRAAQQDGYGRLVLTFQDRTLLPEYDALVANGVLRIRFRDEVRTSVDHVPVKLPGFISIARRDPDGSALRFALTGDHRINTMEAGEKLFIDLLPSNWQGMPPGLPDDVVRELARRAEAAIRRARALEQGRLRGQVEPRVDLRIGTHPTFTRLAFEWNLAFDSAFVREGDLVKVTFNHPVDLDLGQLRAHLPPGVVDATAFTDEGKLKFLLRIEPDVDIRAFREEDSYIVDVTPRSMEVDPVNAAIDEALSADEETPAKARELVLAPADPEAKEAVAARAEAEPAPEEEMPKVSPAPRERVTGAPLPAARPAAAEATADPAPAAETSAAPVPDAAELEEAAEPAAAAAPPAAKAEGSVPAPQTPAQTEATERPETKAEAPSSRGGLVELPEAIDLTRVTPDAKGIADAVALSPEAPPAGYEDEARRLVTAEARRIGDIVRVVFPFAEPVSSAVFRRHRSLWMVLDTADPIDVRGMRSVLDDMVDAVEVTEMPDWQVIRVDLGENALATVGVDGSAWVMTIGNTILEPSRPLSLERNVRGDGGTVIRVPFHDPRNLREIEDPFVGDTVSVVTGFGPARGLLKPQHFAEFDALMSAHGVAILPRTDDLDVKIDGDAVMVERPRGLSISNGQLNDGSRVLKAVADPAVPGQIDLGNLMTSTTEDFLDKIKALEFRSANTPPEDRLGPRMDLSRFYLAHGFAHEALGLMRLAADEDPALVRDPSFNLLMGAAQSLAVRPKEAQAYLERPGLENNADAAVWKTINLTRLRDWTGAKGAQPRGQAVIGNYPLLVQTEFNLAAAESLVEINDFGRAAAVLAEIDPSQVSNAQAGRYDILRGRIADASGRSREALTAFDIVARSDERPLAAEATYRALRIRHRDGDIATEEAANRLAGLATSWRGDEIELKALRFLAQLRVQAGNYRQAFEAMTSALQANSDAETARLLQDEMGAVFAELFLDGGADAMPPVKALALFYDFREMMPIGRRGDEMVRRLANRLVAMDLLDQAAELLKHQVDHRLKGAARAQIAADLGVVYLMDRKPEEALRVLSQTRQAKLPRELERQRNMVEARALTESGRPDLALEIVRNMRGEDVERLRADTLWAAHSWREAGEQLEGIVGGRWSDPIPLADQERADILKAAIAYSLADDAFSLSRLKSKFATKMSDSPEADAFDIVTRQAGDRGVEFMSVVDRLEAIDSLDIFLSEYQRKYLRPRNAEVPIAGSGEVSPSARAVRQAVPNDLEPTQVASKPAG